MKDRTPAFRRWFGDSKVVDAQGEPLVVYHGAPDVRGIFAGGFKRSSMRGDVFFATDDPRTAETYTDPHRAWDYQNAEPGVIPLYLRIENPLVVDAGFQHWRGTEHVIEQARQAGHDGVVIENTIDHYASDRKAKPRREDACTVFAFFSPTQVKSALTGPMKARDPNRWHVSTSQPLDFTGPNDGTFDLDDADLRSNPEGTAPDVDVTRTKAFRRWFGDSKVVDARGEPLVVWHGHPQNVDAFFVFDFDRAIDLGMHFGSEEAAFDVIGSTRSSRNAREHVRPFYLSLRNPLVMEDLGDWISSGLGAFRVPALEQLFKMGIVDAAEYKEAYEKVRAVREGPTRVQEVSSRRAALSSIVRDLILDAGYDGIVYTNDNEDVGSTAWIAFYPEQIKLADGTNTTFDPKSPDIRLNPRPDGEAIAAWCDSNESYAVLDRTASAGSSWIAGACVLLAKALRKRYPEAKLVGIETDGRIQHVGTRIGETVYDALGEHDPHTWVRDWLTYEQLPARTLARVVGLTGVPRSAMPDAESPATPADVALVSRSLP